MRNSRSPIRGGNIPKRLPLVPLPRFRVVRTIIRAERVIIRARSELDALNRVQMYGGWKWWPAHGSDGDPVGDVTCERVLMHRKRGESEETMLAKPVTRTGTTDASRGRP